MHVKSFDRAKVELLKMRSFYHPLCKFHRIKMIDLFLNIDKLKLTDIEPFCLTLKKCKFYSIRIYGIESDYREDYHLGQGGNKSATKN